MSKVWTIIKSRVYNGKSVLSRKGSSKSRWNPSSPSQSNDDELKSKSFLLALFIFSLAHTRTHVWFLALSYWHFLILWIKSSMQWIKSRKDQNIKRVGEWAQSITVSLQMITKWIGAASNWFVMAVVKEWSNLIELFDDNRSPAKQH